ncbi:5-dehydro-2-deoxygluconokinase [Roseivivax lentus]|uniref:5-dehydro-2-deoxygluconokinase n=1 Tax=Roseivivax lentus TaxID=633194 RepID=A0A1N7LP10_9RHOB|nr:5-dehydro-2-deoxygluconokinase [Roseivivax lentus]SIS75567.1 5-dehydro-2-deoxygluconokinase [Roseivivax lentus]
MAGLSPDAVRAGIENRAFVILGRAGMDLFAHPPGTSSEEAEEFHSGLGGSSANIAAGLCKLGAKAALVTSVSDDAVGRFCLNQLKRYGVETRYVSAVRGEFRTSLAIYESRNEGFQNVIYRNGAADFQMTEADIAALDLTPFGAMVATGTCLAAEPSRAATFAGFARAAAEGLPVIFDIDYRPYSWPSPEVAAEVLSRAGAASDVIIGNDEEFDFMAGAPGQGLAKARALAAEGAAIVVYKMGAGGAITFAEGAEIRTGIFPVEALKPVGAGDSFMAGLLASLGEGRDLRDAILRGSACAAIVVSKPGCAPAMPDSDQLAAFLADHPGPTEV